MDQSPISPQDPDTTNLLARRARLTTLLETGPLDPTIILQRAEAYHSLAYFDLAAADAYVALTLAEDPDDDDFFPECKLGDDVERWPEEGSEELAGEVMRAAMGLLVRCLAELGCLRDAWEFLGRLKELVAEDTFSSLSASFPKPDVPVLDTLIATKYRQLSPPNNTTEPRDSTLETINSKLLPNTGLARREIYPWNTHEPDRTSPETLSLLNARLSDVAPLLKARVSVLPDLSQPGMETRQLGLFAKQALAPGTEILREKSLLTAIRSTSSSLCDACAAPLPQAASTVACDACAQIVFCSERCREMALEAYHSAKEGQGEDEWPYCANEYGLEDIGRDPTSETPSDDLYFLLMTRAVQMAERRKCHPLELEEVKHLFGEFQSLSNSLTVPCLPFSLQHSILLPLRYFTTLLLSDAKYRPYSSHWLANFDFWTIQTLYAKVRGVASARQSTWDGRPEVAAVHWRWCLANHSCAPGVRWAWGAGTQAEDAKREGEDSGEIVFRVREMPAWRDGEGEEWQGIKEGEEIMSHYCDVELSVGERRAWALGALGGECRCERCLWESGEKTGRRL